MTNLIAIGSPEHAARLAWRREGGDYRDGQRYTPEALTAVTNARIEEEQRHTAALVAGGYQNPFDLVDEALETDPVVVSHKHIARELKAAEQLLDVHIRTGIDLSIFGGVSDLVDWALDYVGIAFDADVAPEPCEW